MAQVGEKGWFRKIGEDGVSLFASRTTQGIFFVHHDRTGVVSCITKNGVVPAKNGRDSLWTMHGMLRTGVACVVLRGKWWLLIWNQQRKLHLSKKDLDVQCQGLYLKEFQKLCAEKILRIVCGMCSAEQKFEEKETLAECEKKRKEKKRKEKKRKEKKRKEKKRKEKKRKEKKRKEKKRKEKKRKEKKEKKRKEKKRKERKGKERKRKKKIERGAKKSK